MKKDIISKVICGATFMALASCSINSWNDQLDGFEGDSEPTDVQAIEYTLTDADYATLAANATNKTLAGDNANELKNVGTKHCFNSVITPAVYVPAFLSDPNFSYFTLSNGSAIRLTYNVAVNAAPEIASIEDAQLYEVSEVDYTNLVWKSKTDYINSFAPSKPASKYLTTILDNNLDEAVAGDYVIVNYNSSNQEPVFGSTNPPIPTFTPTNVIGSVTLDASVEIKGIVTAICKYGYIITDNSGSLFVYYGSSFDMTSVALGDQLSLSGTIGAYNKGFQLTGSTVTAEKAGTQAYTYPTAKILNGAGLDEVITRTDNKIAELVQITGTVAVSGNNVNIVVDGAATAKGSVYAIPDDLKAQLVDGSKVSVSGYFIAIAGSKYVNIVVTKITSIDAAKAQRIAHAKSMIVPTSNENAVYYFNGTSWKPVTNAVALGTNDYTAMGQTYGNLTTPDIYLPTFLKTKFPYAQSGDNKFVTYKLYANGSTSIACDEYNYNGSAWVKSNGMAQETAQFVKNNGKWMFDPNVTITLPAVKGNAISVAFYQECSNWVYENIDKPLGSTSQKSGLYYVSKYGNNEYYCGTSAYNNDIDLRPSKAKEQYPAGFEGMDDNAIMELMKVRFCTEVAPGTLATLYPDAVPIDGLEVIYTINFAVYHEDASTTNEVAKFKVIGKGKFEPISCTWFKDGVIPTKD